MNRIELPYTESWYEVMIMAKYGLDVISRAPIIECCLRSKERETKILEVKNVSKRM